jgi:lipoprotein NlpI
MQARLLRNIGVAFLNQGMYSDARDNFEAVQRIRPNAACAFNYLICSFMITTSVEQADALKAAFKELIQVASQSPKGAVDLERSDFKVRLFVRRLCHTQSETVPGLTDHTVAVLP